MQKKTFVEFSYGFQGKTTSHIGQNESHLSLFKDNFDILILTDKKATCCSWRGYDCSARERWGFQLTGPGPEVICQLYRASFEGDQR